MKKSLFFTAALLALATVSCRKIEADGEKEIIVINGGGTSTGKRVELTGRITKDTVLRKGDENILKGLVYITKGITLTVEQGAVVKGSYAGADVAALIIARGGKIIAVGTASEPVVFTSSSPNPQSGDWGGIILCGKAAINTSYLSKDGLYQVEGGVDNAQGDGLAGSGDAEVATPINNDNSGKMSYVRIEYAGYAFQPDKEINSLTMAGVGSGTTIDHIQVTYAKDDAFEWFGGTVNCKYLVAWKTQDDDFDTDNGYSGKVQFGLVIRDSLIADISTSEAFESDNNSSGSTATPKTSVVFSNITAIGPRAALSNSANSLYRAGAQIRRNSALSIYNSIIMGWPQGILIDASTGMPTDKNIEDSTLRVRYTTLAGNTVNLKYTASASAATGATDASILSWFANSFFGNTILTNTADAKLIQPFNYTAPDPTPFAGSNGYQPIVAGGNFTEAKVQDPFFTPVNFRGAIAPAGAESTWWKGWTKFN
ncbi:MAG: hypothetical protein JWP88_1199 [Flaviaesturariibacter sp.]|nr:hypothetical protein [Flaviaesturariibacter sp.]